MAQPTTNESNEHFLQRAKLMQEVFETQGWGVLVEDLNNEVEVIKTQLLYAQTWDEVNHLRGRVEQLLQLANLEDTIANMVEHVESLEEENPE